MTTQLGGGERAKRFFNSQKPFYLWAKEYIYGIEKDYRLAKTTKISTFLNGDGDANIIFGDGLDSFNKSEEYRGILKTSDNNGNNEQFDILVANPPYSVSGFKTTLKNGKESFSLFDLFSDKSSEIECLFIERAKQLIKEGGCVGIILPSSILTNSGAYTATRDIIFKHFEIKALVELGGNTFMATNTNTVVLFLRKISDLKYKSVEKLVHEFTKNQKDIAVNGIEKAFSKYIEIVYGLDFKDYVGLFKHNPSDKLLKSEQFEAYLQFFASKKKKDEKKYVNDKEVMSDDFFKYVIDVEMEKMISFFIAYNQKVVLSKTPESSKKEKVFLGYEFSNRRGYEGIKIYTDSTGNIVTRLYNEGDLTDPKKLNSYILKNFNNEALVDNDIIDDLRDNVGIRFLYEFIDYSLPTFDKKLIPTLKKKLKFDTKYPLEKLRSQVDYIQGVVYDKGDEIQSKTSNRILTASNIDFATNNLDFYEEKYLKKELAIDEDKKLKKGDLFICTSSGSIRHLGKVALIEDNIKAYFGGFCAVLRSKKVLPKYLYSILNTQEFRNYVELRKGQNINNLGKDYLLDFRFPLPPESVQKNIVGELDKIDLEVNELHKKNQALQQEIDDQMAVVFSQHKGGFEKIGGLTKLVQRGKSAQYGFSNVQVIKSGQIRGYYNFDFSEQYFASENCRLDQRKLESEDILINSTGVGTAGRVNLFNLKGDFVVDSHVTIVRLKKDVVLSKFVLYSLAHIGFSEIEKMAEGQSGQIELAPETIKNIKIPVPSMDQQREIIKKIELIENMVKKNFEQIKALRYRKVDVIKKYI